MGVLRVVEHGLLYGAVPCSSFVFMSAGSHKRSDNHPWGEERYPFVYDGNALGSRFLLLCLLAIVRNAKWMLENPRCTSLSLLPPLKYLLSRVVRVVDGCKNISVRTHTSHTPAPTGTITTAASHTSSTASTATITSTACVATTTTAVPRPLYIVLVRLRLR